MTWTDAKTDVLRQLWAEGHSCSQIARMLGGCTRNAIIGKAHRLGLPPRAPNASPVQIAARLEGLMGNVAQRRTAKIRLKPKRAPVLLSSVASEPLNIGLMQLGAAMCHWPTNEDRPHLFCGRPCQGSYCPEHQALATVPITRTTLRTPTDKGDGSWRTFDVIDRQAA